MAEERPSDTIMKALNPRKGELNPERKPLLIEMGSMRLWFRSMVSSKEEEVLSSLESGHRSKWSMRLMRRMNTKILLGAISIEGTLMG